MAIKKPASSGKTAGKPERVRLLTPAFAISFPALWEAKQNDDGKTQFGATGIWTPAKMTANDKVLWLALKAEIDRVSVEAFGVPRIKLPQNIKRGLRNGNEKEGIAGYGEGTFFASMTSNASIGVVNMAKEEISPDAGNASEIYPGAICRARVTAGAYNFKDPKTGGAYKGLKLYLSNVQRLKGGVRLDSRVAPEDDFNEDVDAEWLDDSDDEAGEEEDYG